MAIELQQGAYALQQETLKKTVLLLKLTDSALRAIDVYQDQALQNGKPKIRFNRSQGVIRIPAGENGEQQTFTFQLSALNQPAAIECLQQFDTRDSTGMISVLGGIQQKITINATDDSYNTTKKRMEIVKELEKNTSTKVIKQPSSSKLGKKVFRRQILDQKTYSEGRNSTPPPGRSGHAFPRSASPLTMRSVSPVTGSDLAGVRNKTKPILSSLSSSAPVKSSTFGIAGKPLQEKVLHYLALKPIRYQDLINKLSLSASPPNKTKLQNILQQIATARSLRNGVTEYILNNALYSEVRPNWPGYTEEEKTTVKRKIAEISQRSNENRKRQQILTDPVSKNSLNNFPNRTLQEETYSNPVKKKARVSLYNRSSPNTGPRSVSPLENSSPLLSDSLINSSSVVYLDVSDMTSLGLPATRHTRKPSPKRPSSVNGCHGKSTRSPKRTGLSQTTTAPPDIESIKSFSNTVNPNISNKEAASTGDLKSHSNTDNEIEPNKGSNPTRNPIDSNFLASVPTPPPDPNQSSPTADSSDEFIQQYGTISEAAQREEYKTDFYKEYKEYLGLHQKVGALFNKFSEWRKELKCYDKNTDQYKNIAKQVYNEFYQLKKGSDFARLHYLHRKLKHIKARVYDFDRQVLLKNNGRLTGTGHT